MDTVKYSLYNKIEIEVAQLKTPDIILKEYINEIYNLGDKMGRSTNVKATMMTSYKIFKETNKFNPILNQILLMCNYMHSIDTRHEMVLSDAWGAVYKDGDFTITHDHTPKTFSFVYYLNDTNKSTPIVFTDIDWQHTPKKNELIFFPSYLKHKVPKHIGNDRVILAGNFDFIYEGVKN